jgi:hypothetical protein
VPVPVAAPPDTEWELVGTVAAPTAPETIGSGVVDDGLRSCFARSPLGTLYAAVNVLTTTVVDGEGEALVRNFAAAGEGRDAALAALAQEFGTPDPRSGGWLQPPQLRRGLDGHRPSHPS